MKRVITLIAGIIFFISPISAFSDEVIITCSARGEILRVKNKTQNVDVPEPNEFDEDQIGDCIDINTFYFFYAWKDGQEKPKVPNCVGKDDEESLTCWFEEYKRKTKLFFNTNAPVSIAKVSRRKGVDIQVNENNRKDFEYIEMAETIILHNCSFRGKNKGPDPNCGRHPLTGEQWCW